MLKLPSICSQKPSLRTGSQVERGQIENRRAERGLGGKKRKGEGGGGVVVDFVLMTHIYDTRV